MAYIKERESTHIYHVNRMSKEEMDSMINRCIYEEPAYCVAECPMKLDTRAVLSAAAAGNLKKALSLYEKITPFPVILSAGCEAPCQKACKLKERGEGIAIREVERAIAKYGERTKSSGVFRMRKKKKAAIFGSGLFPLFLAGELERKMYPTTIFCQEKDCSDYLKTCAPFLSEEEHTVELARLKSLDLSFEFGCSLTKEFIEEKRDEADIFCGSAETARVLLPDCSIDEELMLVQELNMVTGSCSTVMEAALGAKRAALSVDRLAQKLSPAANRGKEGAVATRLITNLEGIPHSECIPMGENGYTSEEAIREAGRCIQCHCEECFKGCAYLREYKKHPGLLAREIYNNTQIIMGDHQMNKPMNSCSLCGQCTVTCPNGFDMGNVCRSARENMVSTDKMPLAAHEFALMDMLFSNGEAWLARKQPGFDTVEYVFFPGCQAAAIAPGTVEAAYQDLSERLGGGVGLLLGCCGAIADWAGRQEMLEDTKEKLKTELAKMGSPVVIAGCPSCMKQLAAYGIEVTGIWQILQEIGLPSSASAVHAPAAIHDSCGARGNKEVQRAVRELVEKMGGTVVETPYSGDFSSCCGYGGLTSYANRDLAKKMTESCLDRTELPYITYCMACRDRFVREGRESRHILELVYGTDAGAPPDISEKRYNRLSLVQNMLKNIWKEDLVLEDPGFTIEYTEDALAMMDDRMILKSDVVKVLAESRETGEIILDEPSGQYLCRSRLGNVTFWVRYTETETGCLVHRAYSHRMNIVKRAGQ
ncbi:MAG: heterodisulfide reductase-related iron-sulfur binding cluster [Lachnospiraceae bacterium]|nr:heterodisulfide reductase-related iron-sulfur binding cluster [Lachnospiraceae bacterium]